MSFVSYALRQADVRLWRVLKDFKNGVFIDATIKNTVDNSITQFLYEYNWNGINITTTVEYLEYLRVVRSKNINLLAKFGMEGEKLSQLPFVDCDALVNTYFYNKELCLLCICADDFILEKIGFLNIHPKFVVIAFLHDIDEYNKCAGFLELYDYIALYFDGVNGFFCKKNMQADFLKIAEPIALKEIFIPYKEKIFLEKIKLQELVIMELKDEINKKNKHDRGLLISSIEKKQELQQKLVDLELQFSKLKSDHDKIFREKNIILNELNSVYNGTIWRMTKPVRILADFMKSIFTGKQNNKHFLKLWFLKFFRKNENSVRNSELYLSPSAQKLYKQLQLYKENRY